MEIGPSASIASSVDWLGVLALITATSCVTVAGAPEKLDRDFSKESQEIGDYRRFYPIRGFGLN
jgi:hypothetical protein